MNFYLIASPRYQYTWDSCGVFATSILQIFHNNWLYLMNQEYRWNEFPEKVLNDYIQFKLNIKLIWDPEGKFGLIFF